MNAITEEVLDLYHQGYKLNEILETIKENQQLLKNKKEKKNKKGPPIKKREKREAKKEEKINKDMCLNLKPKKKEYPKEYSKIDIKEKEVARFNNALAKSTGLTPGKEYKVLRLKGKSSKVCFVGKYQDEETRYVRLIHEHGYSETFLKADLLTGEYQIKEVLK